MKAFSLLRGVVYLIVKLNALYLAQTIFNVTMWHNTCIIHAKEEEGGIRLVWLKEQKQTYCSSLN